MINEKVFYYVKIELLSPLSVGNGDEDLTDHDCLRNNKGIPFISGSSLAGVFSHYLTEEQRKIFAPEKNDENMQSPYFISDANIINEVKTSIRDGVKLTENKIAEDSAKYDFEILETGSQFEFRIELTIRDNQDSDQMKNIVDILLNGLNNGEILIGFKSKRGYGKVKIEELRKKVFTSNMLKELVEFDKFEIDSYDTYSINTAVSESKYDYIQVNLKQLGGLSIRKYSAKAGEVDFEHIKSNNKPVIPGTSWAGLIRKQINNYLAMDLFKNSKIDLDMWFGKNKNKEGTAQASNIIVEESHIEEGKEILLTRTKISRFSGGASDSSLFSEKAWFNGNTVLGIKVKKEILVNGEKQNNEEILGLISLVIKDIDNGLIALGGQTSIGRGLFRVESCKLNGDDFNLDESMEKIVGGEYIG